MHQCYRQDRQTGQRSRSTGRNVTCNGRPKRRKEKALGSRADAITLVLASIVAPVSSSNATMPLRPHLAATCSGVIEFCTKRIHSTFNQSINQYSICSSTQHCKWIMVYNEHAEAGSRTQPEGAIKLVHKRPRVKMQLQVKKRKPDTSNVPLTYCWNLPQTKMSCFAR